jgi:hypothetical protein
MALEAVALVVPVAIAAMTGAVVMGAYTSHCNSETYAADVQSRNKNRKKKRKLAELQLSGETPAGRKARERREKELARGVRADALVQRWMTEAASEIETEQDAVWDKALGRAYDTYESEFEDVPEAYRESARRAAAVQLAGEMALEELVEMEVSRALTLENKRLCRIVDKF